MSARRRNGIRNNQTKDMSFNIKNTFATAFGARGLQERKGSDRRAPLRAPQTNHKYGVFDHSDELLARTSSSVAVRRAQNFQATLNETLSFLQTQEAALERFQQLFTETQSCLLTADTTAMAEFHSSFESLVDEKFNGINLFSKDSNGGAFYMDTQEASDSVAIHRPEFGIEPDNLNKQDLEKLATMVVEALFENKKEQNHLRDLFGTVAMPSPVETEKSATLSKNYFLQNSKTALQAQANSAHDAVLRLFN